MNTPLVLFKNKLPQDVLNIIQSYVMNDFVHNALKEYYSYLYYKKELYEDFAYQQYILPHCYCYRYYNSRAQRWKDRECRYCYEYEYTKKYIPSDYQLCIEDNKQYSKI